VLQVNQGQMGGDALSMFGPCYALMRGSSRLLVAAVEPGAPMFASVYNQTIASSTPLFNAGSKSWLYSNTAGPTPYGQIPLNFAGAFQELTNNQSPGEYSILPYASTPSRLMQFQCRDSDNVPLDPSQPTSFLTMECDSEQGFRLYRSFGDDAQLGYFVGCPPILLGILLKP